MNIVMLLLIGLSLSMDSFSLSLSVGTMNYSFKNHLLLSVCVGIFHFIMPMLGTILGNSISKNFSIDSDKLLFFLFLFIFIEMVLDLFNKSEKKVNLSLANMLLFAFSVSLDSFTIGIGLNNITTLPILGYFIFMICAFTFTIVGLTIGKKSYNKYGLIAKIIGLIIILCLAISQIL